MKKLASVFLFSLVLLGCATSQNKSNFTDPKVKNYFLTMQSISDNTSEMLINVYPPAQTKFKFVINEIDKEDIFGKLLLNNLRNAGYGINETPKGKKAENYDVNTSYIPFSYLLKNDRNNKKNYNLILNINNHVITRSYTLDKQGKLIPNSSWTKRN